MKDFIKNLRNNNTLCLVLYAVDVCVTCLLIFYYMLTADISQAPIFIYSQFQFYDFVLTIEGVPAIIAKKISQEDIDKETRITGVEKNVKMEGTAL